MFKFHFLKSVVLALAISFLGLSTLLANPNWESDSLYHLTTSWQSQTGSTTTLADFTKQPVILSLIYTSCPTACPLMVGDIKAILRALPEKQARKVKVVLVSLDSENETPDTMKDFVKKMKLNDQWTILTSTAGDVRDLAGILGFQYRPLKNGGFSHSTTLYFVNGKGQVLAKRDRSDEAKLFVETISQEISKK